MGHPRKKRKKYSTPKHPWQSERLEREKGILEIYCLKNKKEIWKMQSILKKYTSHAKRLANLKTEQAKKEREQMINKLFKLGLLKKNAGIDDVLGLTMEDILERRLQTMVYRKNMTDTPRQARQFIVHGHIVVGNQKVNVPSYLVKSGEEDKIGFKEGSSLIGKFGEKEEEKMKLSKKDSTKDKVKKKVVKRVVKRKKLSDKAEKIKEKVVNKEDDRKKNV